MWWLVLLLLILLWKLTEWSKQDRQRQDPNPQEPFQDLQHTKRQEAHDSKPQDPKQWSREFLETYRSFLAWYHPFLSNWREAITTMYQIEKQTRDSPSKEQMQEIVDHLSKTGVIYPPVTGELPPVEKVEKEGSSIAPRIMIPDEPQPYVHALQWMNERLRQSLQEVQGALQGTKVEGFDATPECAVWRKCQEEQQTAEKQEWEVEQERRIQNMKSFLHHEGLMSAFRQNQELAAKARVVKQRAESGEILQDMAIPQEPRVVYSLPPGSNAWKNMQQTNPGQSAMYEKRYPGLVGIKQWSDQINGSLR